jgi:hypothetical protein
MYLALAHVVLSFFLSFLSMDDCFMDTDTVIAIDVMFMLKR